MNTILYMEIPGLFPQDAGNNTGFPLLCTE